MFQTKPINGRWLADCRAKGWTLGKTLTMCPELEPLKRKLLSLGGTAACIWGEPDYEAIMTRGQAWDGRDVLRGPGAASRCHGNVSRLWETNKDFRICTGWALSDDGMWRSHSWGLLGDKIVETTASRVGYFGFVMTDDEAARFAAGNL